MKFRNWVFCATFVALLAALPAAGQSKTTQTPKGPAPENVLRLDDLVSEALRANPEIRAAELRVEALRARVPQAKALPDPAVSVGWMGRPIPFDSPSTDPMAYRGVSAMQTFPFPGKLKLRGQVADRESQAAWWEYEGARRSVVSQVKVAYFEYAYFHKALEIIENNRILLNRLTKIAETRYEGGKGLQQDVLKGHVELSQLLERITILSEEEQTAVARINTLLNRDPQTPLAPPSPLAQSQLSYTLDELYRLAQANDTGLQRDQRMIERDQDSISLARKSYDPDFSVSYMYQQKSDMEDMYGGFVTVNIPI